HSQPVITLGRPVNEKAVSQQSLLLPNCGGGPCQAMRWTGGAAWVNACPNSGCDIDDGPSANGGIVRCGNSAETQSNIHPNSCYDPTVFTATIGGTCTDPNTGMPVTLTLPLVDQQVLWFNFDVRAFAGGYDFQVIGGNEDVAWILYYSNTPQCCLGGFTPGISGNCNSLTYYACGTSFNNWASQPFTTPIFDMTTNVYLLVWDQGFSKGNTNDQDFSINFKARFGCGENCAFLTNGAPVITCQSNGSYTVFQNVVGTSTTVTVVAPGSTSIVTNPDPLTFTDLSPGPPTNVNSGTVTVTYPSGVNYNITMTPSGTGTTCNPITLSGTAPVCCVPPTCTIDGPTSVCPNSTNVHCGPVGAGGYSWSITGAGTINGSNTNSCVTVTASSACNSTYTLTLEAGAPGCTSTCMYAVTVSDVSAPMISCPSNLTIQCTASTAPGGANGTATATDNCSAPGAVTITSSDVTTAGTCPQAYSITRTWKATDACGNSSTCNQLISIIDNTAPNITCPADLTFQCASQVPPPNTSLVSATDLCGTATISFVADVTTNQTCINRYTLTRTYRATDACGNSTTCNQIITVNDQSPPTIICPANVTVSCIGQVPAVNIATVMTMDNCGSNVTVTFVGDAITGTTCTNRLTVTRTYRATDACGNSATCNQIITVFDQTPPSITCPANVTVTCAINVPAPDITTVTKSDNCGGTPTVTFVSDVTSNQTCTNRYTLTRTYRATDACGNSATCTQTIVVNDQTPPTLTCPVSGSVSCASQVPAPNVASVTATDNCGGVPVITFVSDVTTNQTCVNRYTLTRTYRATDACGNSATCTQVIVVNDVTAPTLTCPANATFQCASQVPAPNTGSVTATDNCNGVPTITFVSDVTTNQTCVNRYILTRTYRATDECGNSATCTQVITVFDNTLPSITCPANVTVQCASQVPAPNTGSVTTSDNCGGTPTVAFVNDVTTNQTCLNRYNVIRTYSATDACGNSATCSQTIVVFDNTVPSITCPGNVTVQCASQVPAPNTGSVTASDNCNGAPIVTFVGDVTTNQTCANRYTLTRTYRATDECGNSATCTQVITVNDQTPPSITCPASVTVQCASLVPVPNTTSVTASDNCAGAPSITFVNDVTTNQTCLNRYLVTRTYRATDACGNSATCTQTITVFDNTVPTITCPANVTVQCASQVPAPNVGAVTSSDNCNGVPTVTFVGDVTTNQTCTNRYILTRTYRATDECGNSATCTQTITVFDNTIPTLTCPSNVTVQCASQVPAPNTGAVTASDNCGVTPPSITFVGDVTTGQTCINRYTVIRTYRATDVCGNSATCTQTILVFDNTVPSITCPANITVTCSTDVPAPNTGIISASDNCNGTPQITFVGDVTANQICTNKYILIRTYRATDECGNSATCSYLITVNDQTPPTITCPADVTVSCTSQVPPVNLLTIVASDNCTGTIIIQHVGDVTTNQTCANRYTLTRTYRAIDACGNSTSCNQVITVFDNTPPVIFCPPDITVGVQESTNPENTGFPQSTDICSGLPQLDYIDVTTEGICALEYTIDRTWTATDACGNSATCAQVIEVSGGCFLDLSLDKSLATGQSMVFTPGDDITFSIRVTNNGNIPVGSIEVVDYIPIGFSLNDPDWTAGTDGSTGQ
ncbi:MAG TPA: hypothetical protein VJ508_09155, partial [Saprospiraceae bacterium]|nr:hypothetical protein [Saprospiraceae bacterium]